MAISGIPRFADAEVHDSLRGAVTTFEQAFCADHKCNEIEFRRRVFWYTLPPHAVFVAALLGGYRSRFFTADREFIAASARATTVDHIREEIHDYIMDSNNRGWLRRRLLIRISARRLKALARTYLPDPGSRPPMPAIAPSGTALIR